MNRKYTFPQDWGTGGYADYEGDPNDAANFGSLVGAARPVSALIRGLKFQNVDYTNLTFDVTDGKAYLVDDGITASTANVDRDEVGFVNSYIETSGLSIEDQTVNHVFAATDLSINNEPYIEVNSTNTPPSNPNVKIGEIDTDTQTTSEQWNIVSADGTLTFPDKEAALSVAPELPTGTIVYSRQEDSHLSVIANSLKPVGKWRDDDGDGTYTLPNETDGIDVAALLAESVKPSKQSLIPEYVSRNDIPTGDEGMFYISSEDKIIYRIAE